MRRKLLFISLMLLSGVLFAAEGEGLPAWITNLSMKGDLRLRQHTDWDSSVNYARSRQRLRLRIGFDTKSSDNIKVSFGLATGSERLSGTSVVDSDPASTNSTLSNGFGKTMLMVDYACLEYTPFSWIKITGGKMRSGTQIWQTTDLKWDTDINPDGFAVNINKDVNQFSLFLNASWLIINELNSAQNNPDAYIVQPGVNVKLNDKYSIKAALAFETFNVNAKNTGYYGTPAFDYICINPSIEMSVKKVISLYSLSLFTDIINNTDSKPAGDKKASAYGVRFGDDKIQKHGDWQASFINKKVETNSWLPRLGDSDFFSGAVNMSGNILKAYYGLTKTTALNAAYYGADAVNGANASTPKSLVMLDLVYKF
jgi:hypothetical protein